MRIPLSGPAARRLATLCLVAVASACSDGPTGPGPVEVTASHDGRTWSADLRPSHPFAILNGTSLELRAVRTERTVSNQTATSTLIITIPNYRGIGTYPLGGDSGNHADYSYVIESSGVSYSTRRGSTGSVTISAVDARDGCVSGRFAFEALDARGTRMSMQNGRFIGPLVRF